MIKVQNTTEKYDIEPKRIIESSFESAYTKTAVTVHVTPPDTIVTIFSVISMILLAGMFFLTAKYDSSADRNPALWYTLASLCAGIIAYIISKHMKSEKLYKQHMSGSKTQEKDKKKEAFFEMLEYHSLPEKIHALELARKVSGLMSRQTDFTYLTALRQINDKLSNVNNPDNILCKMISTIPGVFPQPKRRFYLKEEDGQIVFYDADFEDPFGEIICHKDDVVSFGEYVNYSKRVPNPGGGKIRPESIIVELKDDNYNLFFEFKNHEYEDIRKIFGGKKAI
ncbi:MAG TPA: hypothetical protein GXZ66_00780 [Clostridiaceae bacterium]|jgi:hypothetical protein|nr:hypothetical protein [Clostridiaceae bacterium]HOA32430.1 hypothetical protein [Clostridia bacterium]